MYLIVVSTYPVINGSTIAEILKWTELNCETVVLSKDELHYIFSLLCAHNYTECTCKSDRNQTVNQTKELIDVFVNLKKRKREQTWDMDVPWLYI